MYQDETRTISLLGDTPNGGVADEMTGGQELVLPPTGNGHIIVSIVGGVYIRCPSPEHHHKFHRNQTHHGSISGGVAEYWSACVTVVVVKGEPVTGGDAGGGNGVRNGGYGGGGEGQVRAGQLTTRGIIQKLIH